MQTSTLRPGLLVSLKSSVNGGVSYTKKTLEEEHIVAGATSIAKWQTERTVFDKDEHERAVKARGRARAQIHNVCILSAFGYLCPEEKEADLEAAINEARRIQDEFNTSAKVTRVTVYVMAGRIAPDDVEAVRAINSEIIDLLTKMETGLQKLDVNAVRTAARDARKLASMLSDDAQKRVADAIETARKSARSIAKSGDLVAQEIDFQAIASITEARTAFLDLDRVAEVRAPKALGVALDLLPETTAVSTMAQPPRVALELDDNTPLAAAPKNDARALQFD